MAFTLKQKTDLELLKEYPEKFLDKIKNKEINLEEFKNESFRGGIGITHILAQEYMNDSIKYESLTKEILLNSSLSLSDSYGEQNAIGHVFTSSKLSSYYSDNTEEIAVLFKLTLIAPDKINDEDYSRIMHLLLNNEETEKFKELFKLKKKIFPNEYWEQIFERVIEENNLSLIQFLVENGENTKEDITYIKWALPTRTKEKLQERSNLLICAMRYSDEIANYFLDNINFRLDGKTNYNKPESKYIKRDSFEENPYRTQFPSGTRYEKRIIFSATHALNEAKELEKPEFFLKIFTRLKNRTISHLLYKEELTKLLRSEKKRYESGFNNIYVGPSLLIDDIISDTNSIYYKLVKDNINLIIKENSDFDKLIFISHILGTKSLPIEEKFFFAEKIIPTINKIVKEKNDYKILPRVLDLFLKDFYSIEKPSFNDISYAGKILNLALNNENQAFSNENLYTVKFYENNDILNTFIAEGLDISYHYSQAKKINPFSFYANLTEQRYSSGKSLNKDNIEKINKNFNTLKTIAGEHFYSLASGNVDSFSQKGVLNFALSQLDSLLFDNLTDNEIIKLAEKEGGKYCISSLKIPNNELETEDYRNITKRMFKLGFSFFHDETNIDFYNLFKHHNDYKFLEDVLVKEDKNLHDLSQDEVFWRFVTTKEISDFARKNGADFTSFYMTSCIAEFDDKESNIFNIYLSNGGNIEYQDENKDNFLHYLIKNNKYKQATHLLTYHPELSEGLNTQDKIPLSYMITSFNREIEKKPREKDEKLIALQKELFEIYLEKGNFSNNKKSKNFLTQQLAKYTSISTIVPHAKEIVSYKIIDAITQPKEEKKNIVRNKI